jgi:hypothetical protein
MTKEYFIFNILTNVLGVDHPSHNLTLTGSNPVPATNLSQCLPMLFRGHRERIQHSFDRQVFNLIFVSLTGKFLRLFRRIGKAWWHHMFSTK